MRSGICVLVLALGLGAPPVMGQDEPADGWDEVRSAFAVGDFSAARDAVDRLSEAEPDSPDALYWSYRLAESPGLARELRRRMLDRTDLAPAVRDLLVLDAAWGAYAAGDFESALDLLGDIAIGEEETAATSGLLGGLCHLARGDAESGRGALAAVTPDDPDYAWARYHLGRLAHAEGDAALAARYFEMAAEARPTPPAAPRSCWPNGGSPWSRIPRRRSVRPASSSTVFRTPCRRPWSPSRRSDERPCSAI